MIDLSTIRRDRAALEAELVGLGVRFKGKVCRCPWHDDHSASAGIYEGEDGVWRFKCLAGSCGFGGDVFDVRAKIRGIAVADAVKEFAQTQRPRLQGPAGTRLPPVYTMDQLRRYKGAAQEGFYAYTDPATGRVDLVVVRFREADGKKFHQFKPNGELDRFIFGAPPEPRPLYNRQRVAATEKVIVVEGEKCVHALHSVGFVATTSPMGAGKASYADWSPLAGKTVYLWPDNDEAGVKHMAEVADILSRLSPAPTVLLIDHVAIASGPKADAADYVAELGGDQHECEGAILAVLQDAGPQRPADGLRQRLEDIASGKLRALAWPWPMLTRWTNALLPGTLTTICGDPGSAKSYLLLEAALHWIATGVPIALYELEEDRQYWQHRALCLLAGDSRLADYEWLSHQGEWQTAYTLHADAIDAMSLSLTVAAESSPTHESLLAWIADQAQTKDIIAIDPITAVESGDKPWIADLRFIMEAKRIMRETGKRLILVTHPKKARQKGGSALDDLAGGAAYQRFVQTVIWIVSHVPEQTFTVHSTGGSADAVDCNRTIRTPKARNGIGTGREFGYTFCPQRLAFIEHGVVVKDR